MNRFSRKGRKGSTASQNFSLRLCVSALKQIRTQLQLKTTANHVDLADPIKRTGRNVVESFFVLTQRKQSRGGAEVFWKGSTASQNFSLRHCASALKIDSHPTTTKNCS